MKNFLLFVLALISFSPTTSAQDRLTENEKLVSLCKVWGYLKYYHPVVSKGKIDWDQELIDNLSEFQNSEASESSTLYLDWLENLGKVKKTRNRRSSKGEIFNKNFDLQWLDNRQWFSQELSNKLRYIEANRNVGRKYYVDKARGVGNVVIKNEEEYKNMEFPSYEYRLLNLFRFWNIIEYFYPHKYLLAKDWDQILESLIPKFLAVDNVTDYHLLLLEMLSTIDDTHAFNFMTPAINESVGPYIVPFNFKLIDSSVVVTNLYDEKKAAENNIRTGDIILEVDGVPIKEIIEKKSKYVPASNEVTKLRGLYYWIFHGKDNDVELLVRSGEDLNTQNVKRYTVEELNFKAKNSLKWEKLEDNIGYVNLGNLRKEDVHEMMDSLWETKALILDVRRNAHSTMYGIGKFLKRKNGPFLYKIVPDLSYPGKYLMGEEVNCCKEINKHYEGQVVLLVNEFTQSHGEFTVMGLQSGDNVITVGSQTAGSQANVSFLNLIGGFPMMFTGVGYFYPDGTVTHGKGVKIDYVVEPTATGIKAGVDEILNMAIQVVNESGPKSQ